jgi:hypothetical protein
MANGYAVCIGLNTVNPVHYQGWNGKLNAPEKDAADIEALLKNAGFKTDKILGSNATRANVRTALANAAASLVTGDILVVFYSGHGGQLPDLDGDEDDKLDETWCLYDGQMLDDELKQTWTRFREDVRILVLSDSCHSGTVAKLEAIQERFTSETPKIMPLEIALSTYTHNEAEYRRYIEEVDNQKSVLNESAIRANVRLISGCQDNQSSYDGFYNSKFTEQLLKVWNGGKFRGNYSSFHIQIQTGLPAYQSPNHLVFGRPNMAYDMQIPFTIIEKTTPKFMVDLGRLSLNDEQCIKIDSAIQKAVSAELATIGSKNGLVMVPIKGAKGFVDRDFTFGYVMKDHAKP